MKNALVLAVKLVLGSRAVNMQDGFKANYCVHISADMEGFPYMIGAVGQHNILFAGVNGPLYSIAVICLVSGHRAVIGDIGRIR